MSQKIDTKFDQGLKKNISKQQKMSNMVKKFLFSKIFFKIGMAVIAMLVHVFPVFAGDLFGLEETAKAAGLRETNLPLLIGRYVGIALSLLGVIFLIILVYGGYLWMTARGIEDQVKKAKEAIWSAVIGIIIVSAAYGISLFIIRELAERAGG